jgi:hypothetical protein
MEQKDFYVEQLQVPTTKNDRIEATQNIDKDSKDYDGHFIQIIPHTANRLSYFLTSKKKV